MLNEETFSFTGVFDALLARFYSHSGRFPAFEARENRRISSLLMRLSTWIWDLPTFVVALCCTLAEPLLISRYSAMPAYSACLLGVPRFPAVSLPLLFIYYRVRRIHADIYRTYNPIVLTDQFVMISNWRGSLFLLTDTWRSLIESGSNLFFPLHLFHPVCRLFPALYFLHVWNFLG